MMMFCYSVYDRKALIYNQPYFAHNNAVAVRSLSDAIADPNSMFGRHPNDYVLFKVASYDDQKGAFEALSPLEHVVDGSTLVQALQQEIPFPEKALKGEK